LLKVSWRCSKNLQRNTYICIFPAFACTPEKMYLCVAGLIWAGSSRDFLSHSSYHSHLLWYHIVVACVLILRSLCVLGYLMCSHVCVHKNSKNHHTLNLRQIVPNFCMHDSHTLNRCIHVFVRSCCKYIPLCSCTGDAHILPCAISLVWKGPYPYMNCSYVCIWPVGQGKTRMHAKFTTNFSILHRYS
jgi:hypothetical protein